MIEAGNVSRFVSPLVKVTVAPPNWAGMVRATLPIVLKPPSTGFTLTLEMLTIGTTDNVANLLTVPSVA